MRWMEFAAKSRCTCLEWEKAEMEWGHQQKLLLFAGRWEPLCGLVDDNPAMTFGVECPAWRGLDSGTVKSHLKTRLR
jgi:hypothetical protein